MIIPAASPIEFEIVLRAMGLIGFCVYVGAFLALSTGRLDSRGIIYFGLVFIASSFVLISLSVDFYLSAALIQGFYAAMSLGAIILRVTKSPHGMKTVTGQTKNPPPKH